MGRGSLTSLLGAGHSARRDQRPRKLIRWPHCFARGECRLLESRTTVPVLLKEGVRMEIPPDVACVALR